MPPSHLHVLGLSLGTVTGWFRITVPRASIFGDERPKFLTLVYDEIDGTESEQVVKIARLAREIEGLDYKIGPAIIIEDFDPVEVDELDDLYRFRIGAMLDFVKEQTNLLSFAQLYHQNWEIASDIDDKVLRRHGMWTPEEHIRAAARQGMMILRRARRDEDLAAILWPYMAWVDD